ncbi:MAG: glycosyltransferase family 9 protein [Phycisphaerales bacterium]
MPPAQPLSTPERILIIRPSALGDVCRSVPMLVTLRAAYPDARIDWLVQNSFADAVANHPMLSAVVKFPRSSLRFGKLLTSAGRSALSNLSRDLRGGGGGQTSKPYDLVIDAQGLGRSGLLMWWTGAARRVGDANARELSWLGANRRHKIDPSRHTVDRMLDLLEREGLTPVHDMRLYPSNTDRVSIDPMLRGTKYMVVAPTSRWEGKRWPGPRFAEVTSRVLDEGLADYAVIVASGTERAQCRELLALQKTQPRIIDQIGRTTVGELMALIEQSSLVLANDSAALHIGVGFDRPIVGLFGPTRTDLVGPYRRERDVIQAAKPRPGQGNLHKDTAAGRRMMEAIDVGTVFRACAERLGSASAPSA